MASSYEVTQPLAIPAEVLAYDYINRARSRNYAEQLKLDIRERELARKQEASSKSLERQTLSEAVQKELEQKNIGRLHRLQYEQLYRNENLKLSQLQRELHQPLQPILPKEHPFVKLVDQQDVRNSQLREKFKYQNKYNEIQESVTQWLTQIKQHQKEITRKYDRSQRQQYEQHVEDDFTKRENSYKKLRLLHTERRVAGISDGDIKRLERDAQHDYLSYLQHQTEEKKHHRIAERNNQSLEMNKYGAVMPENGQLPAFLGLLPFESDRKRQLDVIDRKFGFAVPKYLETLTNTIRQKEQQTISNNRQYNPTEPGRLRVLTEGAPMRIRSQMNSPTMNNPECSPGQLKLPMLNGNAASPTRLERGPTTLNAENLETGPQKSRLKSSMAVRTELGEPQTETIDREDRPSYKTIKSYNFITGNVDVYRVPAT